MQYQLLLSLLLLISQALVAQKPFCKGWKEGYTAGKQSLNQRSFITPICPITIHDDSYENGYAAGFEKATGNKAAALPTAPSAKATFCEGWKKGYANAMKAAGKAVFMTPICPIAPINENNYDAGYLKGYQQAAHQQGQTTSNWVPAKTTGNYCEGWQRGYQTGLQLWADQNNKRKPLKITPICPIAPIHQDGYTDAFAQGQQRAFKDMD